MTDYKRQPSDCAPAPVDPADQPHPPGGGKGCEDLPTTTPPKPPDPKPCPPTDCDCPAKPPSDANCLEKLIAEQTAAIVAADKAKTFKADLEALLTKAKTASQEYTREKYDKLVKQWVEQDGQIAELIRKLVCAVPCWRCILDCYVCPLLNELHYAEERLLGDGSLYADVKNLYDLQYWHTRDKDAKEQRFNRIKAVLAAWEKPAQTIEKALSDNAKIIADANTNLGASAPKVVFDVFIRLVPMHLAIAPPEGSAWETKIDKEYVDFCKCDTGKPDDCCGPDVGELSLRQRWLGPQPYLIDPKDYFDVICCLVEKRYGPAKDALGKAEAAVLTVENDIKRLKALIENGLKSFDKDAKGAIPSEVNCCDFHKEEDPKQQQSRAR
jgi:hypothetical protein